MATQRPKLTYARSLSPFPEGWFYVECRKAILKSKLIQKTWMGEEIIVWSDENGRITVAGAYCPHLGSNLGPDAGGRVCAGRLVCPFHGYEFDATGQCVAIPFSDPPKSARLKLFPTREINGLIFAWWSVQGRKPQWHLPAEDPDQEGWCGIDIRTLRFPGHPQETSENSVDLAHLGYVHRYANVERVGKATIDGPYLNSRFNFIRTFRLGKLPLITSPVTANTHVWGLGYSFVEVREHSVGMDRRLWVLATPVDGTFIDMTLVSQAREIRQPKRKIVGLGFLPVSLRAPLMNWIISTLQVREVMQDVTIWSRKRYVSRPRLSRADGEIMPFRAYCAQFYPGLSEPAPQRRVANTASIQ